jgi:HK97 family phage portal protein
VTAAAFGTFVADAAGAAHASPPAAEPRIRGEELWIFDPPGAGTAGMTVSERTALRLTAILATINVLATDVAVLPMHVYRRRPDGGRDPERGHPVEELWNVSPDGETTPLNWRQALVGHAALWGTGLAEIQRRGGNTPYRMHLLDPDETRPERDRETRALKYRLANGRVLDHGDVFRLAGLGHDGIFGFNFVRMAREAIGVGLAAQGYTADFYSNGAEPGAVLEYPGQLTPEAKRNIRESWDAQHRGYGRRKSTAVLEEGTKLTPYGTDPDKAQLLESRRFQVEDVSRPWRVPPQKIGKFDNAHLANIEASNLDYLQTALMPWLVAIEQEGNLKLLSPAERAAGLYLEHTTAALLRGDIKSRFEAYGKALADGWLNRDEVRERENLNPIGEPRGGRKHLVQVNQTTLERIGTEPAAAAPSAPATGAASTDATEPTGEPTDESD